MARGPARRRVRQKTRVWVPHWTVIIIIIICISSSSSSSSSSSRTVSIKHKMAYYLPIEGSPRWKYGVGLKDAWLWLFVKIVSTLSSLYLQPQHAYDG